jgi:hypothetical protein
MALALPGSWGDHSSNGREVRNGTATGGDHLVTFAPGYATIGWCING